MNKYCLAIGVSLSTILAPMHFGCEGEFVEAERDAPGELDSEQADLIDESAHNNSVNTRQSAEEALLADHQQVAKESNLELAEVQAAHQFQIKFAEIVDEAERLYPDRIAEVWVEPIPAIQGHINFVGDVPSDIAELVHSSAQTHTRIELNGQAALSRKDQDLRTRLSIDALVRIGYEQSRVRYLPQTKKLDIALAISNERTLPSRADLRKVLNEEFALAAQRSVGSLPNNFTLAPDDVDFRFVQTDEPMFEQQHSRGGNWLGKNGTKLCTSAWSVKGPDGDGIITAGHCVGLNEFYQPGLSSPYGMTFRKQGARSQGDSEYHTTTHIEPAEFYANATVIRDVSGRRSTGSMVGYRTCVYGRASNSRNCDHIVTATGVSIAFGGNTYYDLAQTDNVSTHGGDSGAGYSYDTTAWGIHSSVSDALIESYFTPVRIAESALGVRVKIKSTRSKAQ